jgi:hypothetical protein
MFEGLERLSLWPTVLILLGVGFGAGLLCAGLVWLVGEQPAANTLTGLGLLGAFALVAGWAYVAWLRWGKRRSSIFRGGDHYVKPPTPPVPPVHPDDWRTKGNYIGHPGRSRPPSDDPPPPPVRR